MNINEYMKNNRRTDTMRLVKRIECADGFSMSVQAFEFAYCKPRIDDAEFYTHVEVGFPSAKPEFFAEYAEQNEDYTETVYAYVPVELVEQEIAIHGGFAK